MFDKNLSFDFQINKLGKKLSRAGRILAKAKPFLETRK